jgi:hypothetical protein
MSSWRGRACRALALALALTATTSCSDKPGDSDAAGAGTASTTAATAATTTPPGAGRAGATPTSAAPPSLDIPTVGVGESVTGAGYELTIRQVTAPAAAPDSGADPSPGHMFMAVDVELVNRTESARDATYLQLDVGDASGARYQPSPRGQLPPTGFIPADVPQRIQLIYEVPSLATDLVLTLRPDLVSPVAVAVRLR